MISNTRTNRILAKHIRTLTQSLFTVNNTKDFNSAIFEPTKWQITMPYAAIQLLSLSIGKTVTRYYDIPLQIGYSNEIILHRYSYPNPPTKRHINIIKIIQPITNDSAVIKQFNRMFRNVPI